MATLSTQFAAGNLPALLAAASEEPVCIQQDGKPVAWVLSPSEYNWLRQGRWAELNAAITSGSAEAQRNGLSEEILTEILAE